MPRLTITTINFNNTHALHKPRKLYLLKLLVAYPDEAVDFSSEVWHSYLFPLNDKKLPFGCHARGNYEPEFGKDFISNESKGYKN